MRGTGKGGGDDPDHSPTHAKTTELFARCPANPLLAAAEDYTKLLTLASATAWLATRWHHTLEELMQSTMTGSPAALLRLGPDEINALDWRDISGCPGVKVKQLWRSDSMVDTLLSYAPGAATPGHPHPRAHHHIWVVDGQARIGGETVTSGSYVHVPPGVAHPIEANGPAGCLLLHMHRRITG